MSIMELNDKYTVKDTKDFLNSKRPQTSLYTEVDVRNELGELLFRRHNVILLSGRRFTLEKLFNITPSESKILTLDQILVGKGNMTSTAREIPEYGSETWEKEHGGGPVGSQCVCLFGVGKGGAGDRIGDVWPAAAKGSNLYDIVPMRYVFTPEEDQAIKDDGMYYMRMVDSDGGIGYYLKRFESKPTIKIIAGGQDYVPSDVDNTPPYISNESSYMLTDDVDAYVEMTLKINTNDVREWFEAIDADNPVPYINELALYIGYQNIDPKYKYHGDQVKPDQWSDYYGVEAFSKLTFNNEILAEDSKELNIIYRIYI